MSRQESKSEIGPSQTEPQKKAHSLKPSKQLLLKKVESATKQVNLLSKNLIVTQTLTGTKRPRPV